MNINNSPIPYGRQYISEEDIKAVVDTLKSDYLTQGPKISEFEKSFADYVGSKYAVAVANGTAALHISVLALGVKQGDKVITTPITFAASANCVLYCGGDVTFVDIDAETYLLDISKVKSLLDENPRGTFSGIIPVDFSGRAVDLKAFRELADDHDLWLLEDACHAPGGFFVDSGDSKHLCGSGEFADLAIFSFHPVKHITAGEGGMVTTNDRNLYEKLLLFRTHGITKAPEKLEVNHGPWYYEMQQLGYNYRLSDIHASLGLSQLSRANQGLAIRRQLAQRYATELRGIPQIRRQSGLIQGHAYHLYVIETEDRGGLYHHLRTNGVFSQVHYIPVHLMPYYQRKGWKEGDMPNSEEYYRHCLSLPMYPTLSENQQQKVIDLIKQYYQK